MCGIFGGVGVSEADAKECLNSILRGNDGITTVQYQDVVMGSRRHLVKTSDKPNVADGQSDQPYESDDRKTAIVFNGELYTFAKIREILKGKGHLFHTVGDTEVLLRLYEDYGSDFVTQSEIDALFSLAIYDSERRELRITRDWPGRIPLFYYYDQEKRNFLFSSELKGFRPLDWVDLNDPIELKPGSWIVLNLDTFELTTEVWYKPTPGKTPSELHQVGRELHELLMESGQNRTMGDVPICTMLSGGIDSVMSSFYVFANINFDAVDFEPVSYVYQIEDYESEDVRRAKAAAEGFSEIGLDLKVIQSPGAQLVEDIPHIIELFETRKIRALSVYPLPIYYYLAPEMHGDGFKVTVGGHGVDELLGAYDSWKELDKSHEVQIDVRSRLAFINAIYENMMRRASIIFMNRGPIEARFPFLSPTVCEFMLGIDPKWLMISQDAADQFLELLSKIAGPQSEWSDQMNMIRDQVTAYLDNNGRHGSTYSEADNTELEKLFWKLPLIVAGLHASSESWLHPKVLFNAKLRGQHGSGITSLEPQIVDRYKHLGETDSDIFKEIVQERFFDRNDGSVEPERI